MAAGGIALGSKVAMMAKAGGGASGVLKGIGALTAAGNACHFCMDVLKLARTQLGLASTIFCGNTQTLTCPIPPAKRFCDLHVTTATLANNTS